MTGEPSKRPRPQLGQCAYRPQRIVTTVGGQSESPSVEIVLGRCKKGRGTFGMRIEQQLDFTWLLTWSFPIAHKRAQREGYGSRMIPSPRLLPEIPACPHCRSASFIQCGRCRKLTCWTPGEACFSCQWCSNSGPVSGQIESLDGAGDV